MATIHEVVLDSDYDPFQQMLEELGKTSNGQTPIYILDQDPTSNEWPFENMAFFSSEPFTVEDVYNMYEDSA